MQTHRHANLARILTALLVVATLVAVPGAQAAPANDNFANATPITFLPFTDTVSTVGATTEFNEPQPCGGIGATVWYSYTSTTNGPVTLTAAADSFGASFDTVLAVYVVLPTGLFVPLSVTCNDDTGGLQSSVTWVTVPGVTYYIQAGGFDGATGTLTLHMLAGFPI